MKNLLTLHEAIVIALISNKDRQLSFAQVAEIIEKRKLFPFRRGNITLEEQVKLRTLPSGNYADLFEILDNNRIKLKIT
ncbi:MAG: hypothetical protein RIC06_04115 [Cyclobacteriaceae bacterium]